MSKNSSGDSKLQVIHGDVNNLTLTSDVLPPLSLRVSSFFDTKEYDKFLKNVVALVRRSYEYQLWVKYVKQTLGHRYCALTGEVQDEVTIEIHHHPLCLYDICEIVANKHITNGIDFCSMDIAVEVLELHYSNHVGYIPLCKTLHEKFHNGALMIPINLVYGDWRYIISNYPTPDHIIHRVTKFESITSTNHKGWQRDEYVATGT